jgi:hypothetical protein
MFSNGVNSELKTDRKGNCMKKWSALFIITATLTLISGAISAQDVSTAIELLRTDINAKEKDILIKAMNLTEKESTAFWPLYRDYKNDRSRIIDERIALLKEYAQQYESMTDEKATGLMKRLFRLDQKTLDLKQKYFKEFSKALSPRAAARFIQVQNYLANLINVSVGADVPLFPRPADVKP